VEAGSRLGAMAALAELIRERVVVLDGGLAAELERRGSDLSGGMWPARLLAGKPNVSQVHPGPSDKVSYP
jgi:S-methylmethionine-dependent homocysteine/selenocysteine methylase